MCSVLKGCIFSLSCSFKYLSIWKSVGRTSKNGPRASQFYDPSALLSSLLPHVENARDAGALAAILYMWGCKLGLKIAEQKDRSLNPVDFIKLPCQLRVAFSTFSSYIKTNLTMLESPSLQLKKKPLIKDTKWSFWKVSLTNSLSFVSHLLAMANVALNFISISIQAPVTPHLQVLQFLIVIHSFPFTLAGLGSLTVWLASCPFFRYHLK